MCCMKYFAFRDLDHSENLRANWLTNHAYWIVYSVSEDAPQKSGKDLAVVYFCTFSCSVERAWRSLDEVELFEIEEYERDTIMSKLNEVEKF